MPLNALLSRLRQNDKKESRDTGFADTSPSDILPDHDSTTKPAFDLGPKNKSIKDVLVRNRAALAAGLVVLVIGGMYLRHAAHKEPVMEGIGTSSTVLDPKAVARPVVKKTAPAGLNPAASSPAVPASAPMAAASSASSRAIAMIVSASKGQAQVVDTQRGPAGLVAVTYTIGGNKGLAWVDPNRDLVILGTVLNGEGRNLDMGLTALRFASASASAPVDSASSPSAGGPAGVVAPTADAQSIAVRTAMRESVGIATGPKTPTRVWVFVDPDSPKSARFYNTNTQTIAASRVIWIPVAYEDQSSAGRVATILTQLSPANALEKNFKDFNFQSGKGGVESATATPSMLGVALKNTQFLSQVGPLETPTVLFCGKDGAPHVITQPVNLSSVLQIAGPCPGQEP